MKKWGIVLIILGICLFIFAYFLLETNLSKQVILSAKRVIIQSSEPVTNITYDLLPFINQKADQEKRIDFYLPSDIPQKIDSNAQFDTISRYPQSLWQYISIGRCELNAKAPDYLQQKLQKSGTDSRFSPMRDLNCGFIRTNIPFSF